MSKDFDRDKPVSKQNCDAATVTGFGYEWAAFPQDTLDPHERQRIFNDYFRIFPWHALPDSPVGADIGCGSGRWAVLVAPRVGYLHLVDASTESLKIAQHNLSKCPNCTFHNASVDGLPFNDASLDFAYSLGVLHHVPDPLAAIKSISDKLKPGAPFLVYLYYAFDNRPLWFRLLWSMSDVLRKLISRSLFPLRYTASQLLAFLVYWPLAKMGGVLYKFGLLSVNWPLAYYRDKSFNIMRTDALDRFGTRLERRFTHEQIQVILEQAGFVDIRFSGKPPYWCAVGIKQ